MATRKEIDRTIKAAEEIAEKESKVNYTKASERHSAVRKKAADKEERKSKARHTVKVNAKTRKPSIFQKVKDSLLPDDVDSVEDYIEDYIIVPYIINGLNNAISGFLPSFGNKSQKKSNATYIAYDAAYKSGVSKTSRRETRPVNSSKQDYRNIEFMTLGDAKSAIEQLELILDEYYQVSVLDFYDICGLDGSPEDDNWGWYELNGVRIRPIGSHYRIKLPEPVSLD